MGERCAKCGEVFVEGDAISSVYPSTYGSANSLNESVSAGKYHQSCHNKIARTRDSVLNELREQAKIPKNE